MLYAETKAPKYHSSQMYDSLPLKTGPPRLRHQDITNIVSLQSYRQRCTSPCGLTPQLCGKVLRIATPSRVLSWTQQGECCLTGVRLFRPSPVLTWVTCLQTGWHMPRGGPTAFHDQSQS